MFNKVLCVVCFILITVNILVLVFENIFVPNMSGKDVKSASVIITPKVVLVKHPIKNEGAKNPEINAQYVYLVDKETLYPFYGKGENEKVPIASLTKIATALVVLENYPNNLSDVVDVSRRVTGITGDSIKLRYGEKITVENLLYGLLMMSGNDAAASLAEHFGGNDTFVLDMNKMVTQIGAKNTIFQDTCGLDDDGYSTAKDLAIISAHAVSNPKFAEIVKTPTKTITSTNGRVIHELKNSNRMLLADEKYFYPYATGIKTGFTTPAGHVLVSSAEKDGHIIIGVVLNTDKNTLTASAEESKKLLEWGFTNYSW
jgi:D-alanyl-D-alanine carboxypeptidase (penicillin-binding protein 5/6)